MRTSLSDKKLAKALSKIRDAQDEYVRLYPGDSGARQPVHTVYGGANLFTADTARKLGEVALRTLETNAPDPDTFAEAIGIAPALAGKVYERVLAKLRSEPVEDFRIDFEDGYGNRPDDEEDGHAFVAASEVAKGLAAGSLPPFIGIRIKPLSGELGARSLRTLDIFLSTLVGEARALPPGFVITLPKITSKAQVTTLVAVLDALEDKLGLDAGAVKIEFMVETTQCILDDTGRSMLPRLRAAAGDRLTGAHFGTYDYTAGYDITAAHQRMRHAACDFAKHMMKVTFAGTGVALSDGATNIMPVGPHRGKDLTESQKQENRKVIHGAWRLGADDIRHSLVNGYYQGWDLHPGQLPVRYGTVYAFFLDGQVAASERLKNFIDKAAQATLVGDVFDDAATGQGLLNYFLRGIACGAIKDDEAQATGLTLDEIRTRSFVKILAGRRGGAGA
jgi:citrate lyase beta subunit